MTANELLEAGNLTVAIDTLGDDASPLPGTRLHAMTSLFTLLCLAGRWDRAVQQLDAMEPLRDPRSTAILDPQRYAGRSWPPSSSGKQRYFAEGLPPKAFGEPDRGRADHTHDRPPGRRMRKRRGSPAL